MAYYNIIKDQQKGEYTLNEQKISAVELEQLIRQAYHSRQSIEMHVSGEEPENNPVYIYNHVLFDALTGLNRQAEYMDRINQVSSQGIPKPQLFAPSPVTQQHETNERFAYSGPQSTQINDTPVPQPQRKEPISAAQTYIPNEYSLRTLAENAGSPPPTPRGSAGWSTSPLHGGSTEYANQAIPEQLMSDRTLVVPPPNDEDLYSEDSTYIPLVIPYDGYIIEPEPIESTSMPLSPSLQGTQFNNDAESLTKIITSNPANSSAHTEFTQIIEPASHNSTPGPFTRTAQATSAQQNPTPANIDSSDSEPIVVGIKGQIVQNPIMNMHTPAGTTVASSEKQQPSEKPPLAPKNR